MFRILLLFVFVSILITASVGESPAAEIAYVKGTPMTDGEAAQLAALELHGVTRAERVAGDARHSKLKIVTMDPRLAAEMESALVDGKGEWALDRFAKYERWGRLFRF
jgi:hypothetical protein